MLARLTSFVRTRWHPLWRLRQLAAFRHFQRRCDFPVYTRIPGTDLRVAVKFLRDASWIFSPGSLEPEIRTAFKLVFDLFKPTVFWDIGANIGFYSWFVRKHSTVRQIVMFEPDPTNFALITRTIRKNGITNCRPMNVALADKSGEASFLVDRVSGATGSLQTESDPDNAYSMRHAYQLKETITCRTATIDGLVAEGVPAPQLIKIDVEGAEQLVLAGGTSFLSGQYPTMFIETSDPDLVRRLQGIGYTVFRIDDGNLLFAAARAGVDLASLARAFPEYSPAS